MREDAVKRGLKVSEWGIETVETGEVFQTDDEDEVYRRLGYQPIPPEIREGTTELARARAGTIPTLVQLDDLRGDLHAHTDASDGKATLAPDGRGGTDRRARLPGDHRSLGRGRHGDRARAPTASSATSSRSASYAAGARRLHVARRRRGRRHGRRRRCTTTTSCSPASTGWSPRCTSASVRTRERATSRLLAAIENPHVDVVAHPSGRLLGRRDGYEFDVQAVSRPPPGRAPSSRSTAGPHRLDLRPAHARAAIEAGVKLVISTDAHRRDLVRPPRPRRRHGAPGLGDRRTTSRTRAPWAELNALRKPCAAPAV